MTTYVLTVACKSTRGIVAAISGYLADKGCNIVDSSQFDDLETGKFFMRVSFISEEGVSLSDIKEGFKPVAERFKMEAEIFSDGERTKTLLMVSRSAIVSTICSIAGRSARCRSISSASSPTTRLPEGGRQSRHPFPPHQGDEGKQAEGRSAAERPDRKHRHGLVVLARYMQVLSDDMCRKMSGKIINIHHSFLPSFKGANPYKQAYERGVKLIGATAHYVTADLDEGPIIEQDTVRITHAQSADDYVSLGRDVESQVLARAIHAHIHHRTFINGNRTVVFPPSPGSYASERMG